MMLPEKTYATRRYFMNGMLVPIRNCSIVGGLSGSDAQPLDLGAAEHGVEDHAREYDGGEHVGDQADDERDRESLDGAGAELKEEERAHDGGDVGIEDGAERAVVAQLDRLTDALPGAQLLADA